MSSYLYVHIEVFFSKVFQSTCFLSNLSLINPLYLSKNGCEYLSDECNIVEVLSNKFLKMNFLLKYPEKFKGNIYPLTLPFLSSINDLVVLL